MCSDTECKPQANTQFLNYMGTELDRGNLVSCILSIVELTVMASDCYTRVLKDYNCMAIDYEATVDAERRRKLSGRAQEKQRQEYTEQKARAEHARQSEWRQWQRQWEHEDADDQNHSHSTDRTTHLAVLGIKDEPKLTKVCLVLDLRESN